MITEIEMSFRHLRDLALRGLTAVNIIVGPNNAGKTSFFRGVQSLISLQRKIESGEYIRLGIRIEFPDDIKSQIGREADLAVRLFRSGEDVVQIGPMQWWRRDATHDGITYISHGNDLATTETFRFLSGRCVFSPLKHFLKGKEFGAREVSTHIPVESFERVMGPIAAMRNGWLSRSYFLWHRRKSRYEETLGAHHARLDGEAEHLAGRLDHLLSETRGGSTRQRINRFMNAVVPEIGEIGIRRRAPKGEQGTIISVVFSDARGERKLEELGGGVEQTLALALVLIGEGDGGAVFIEEPESHLHESAQRRLIEQIEIHRGSRQVFIATHSPVFVNEFPGANVYRVTRNTDGGATVHPCVDKASQRQVLNELGVLPSSLTQTNCVVWVEGPTETRLVRRWLEMVAPELKVHQHYEFAQTGGSNLVSLAVDVPANDPRGLRDIMRVCRHNFIICDRDAGRDSSAGKAPVQDIEKLVGKHHWITSGYEIEWYVPRAIIAAVWGDKVGEHMATCAAQDEPFYARLASSGQKTKSAGNEKVKWAERFVSAQFGSDVWFGSESGEVGAELKEQVERLAAYIREANQMVTPTVAACQACGQVTPSR